MERTLYSIFISYAREDNELVRKLYYDLFRSGITPWFDEECLLPGMNWKAETKKAIRTCRYFLAVLSSSSVNKMGFVQSELKYALDVLDKFPESSIFIIPIRLNECQPSQERLSDLHWVDMFPDWQKGIEKILSAFQFEGKCQSSLLISSNLLKKPYTVKALTKSDVKDFERLLNEGSGIPVQEWIKIYYQLNKPAPRIIVNPQLGDVEISWIGDPMYSRLNTPENFGIIEFGFLAYVDNKIQLGAYSRGGISLSGKSIQIAATFK